MFFSTVISFPNILNSQYLLTIFVTDDKIIKIAENAPVFGNLARHLGTFESSELHIALMSLQQLSQSASGHCTEGHQGLTPTGRNHDINAFLMCILTVTAHFN